MPQAHIWHEEGHEEGYFWDDAEDHGGFDRNVPCGPFATYELALKDAKVLFPDELTVLEGKPHRYGV